MKKVVLIYSITLLLGGCTWFTNYFSGDDNIEPPEKLVELTNTIRLDKIWSVSTGSGSGERLLRLTPALSANHVYVSSRDGHLASYDINTGNRIWEVDTKKKISAGPGVGFGLVLLGTRDGRLLAYQSADGKPLWSVKLTSEVLSVPEIKGDTIIVRTGDGRLTALSAKDGKKIWDFKKREPALTLRGTSKPLIVDDMVLSGFDNGQLVSLSLKEGRQIWRRKVAIPRGRTELERIVDLDADPVIDDKGVIYVAAFQGNVAAINLADGRLIWRRELSSYAGLTVGGDHLFVTDDRSQLWSLHTKNGASLWRQDKLQRRSLTAPVVFGKYVVVGDFEGYLHWLDQSDGRIVARMRGDSNGFSVSPVTNGKILISLGKGGELSAFQLK
ncbi:MAG TPA: outer membrane protein assembly factor BamB [Gammaproteobacteria bacterium]|nr:outer membrane protein assembly factor BamB [Gammaproteobacteria bacterium]